MELVEGESLAGVLAPGAIPVDEALPIALQIAKAMETAHEHGVIHRDLKPANVMVDSEGQVKVLDFGLAKAFDPEGSGPQSLESIAESPTITADMTRAGVLLGTAAYMSPEQACGKAVDKRVDIWAFGCVLWEMLTGTRAFAGTTSTEILAAIIKGEPDWETLRLRLRLRSVACLNVASRRTHETDFMTSPTFGSSCSSSPRMTATKMSQRFRCRVVRVGARGCRGDSPPSLRPLPLPSP